MENKVIRLTNSHKNLHNLIIEVTLFVTRLWMTIFNIAAEACTSLMMSNLVTKTHAVYLSNPDLN